MIIDDISLAANKVAREFEFKALHHPVHQFVLFGESIEIRACARDLRLRMDPESGSGGADTEKMAKPIRARF
jgi:hypothetical protein